MNATGEFTNRSVNPPVMEGPEVTGGLRAPKSNRGVNGRLFYQIYWDNKKLMMFSPSELAGIIKALAGDLVLFNPYKPGQMVLMLRDNVEVKVGYNRFVHISSPDPSAVEQVWQRISTVLMPEEEVSRDVQQ